MANKSIGLPRLRLTKVRGLYRTLQDPSSISVLSLPSFAVWTNENQICESVQSTAKTYTYTRTIGESNPYVACALLLSLVKDDGTILAPLISPADNGALLFVRSEEIHKEVVLLPELVHKADSIQREGA